MDDIVKAALKKWPNVPDCHGWLALDARGDWYMRDDSVQAAGPFPRIKGSRIEHVGLREFIGRNYLADADGNWFFQNGPQKVHVQLEAAPWVWRLQRLEGDVAITSHTDRPATFESAWLDEHGRMFLVTDLGPGIVHSLDMDTAATQVESGEWAPADMRLDDFSVRFAYRLSAS